MEWGLSRLWEIASVSKEAMVWVLYVAVVAFTGRGLARKHDWKEYVKIKRWGISLAAAIFFSAVSIALFFHLPATVPRPLTGLVVVTPVLAAGSVVWNLWKGKSRERRKMDQCIEEEKDFLKVYRTLETVDEKKLTPKERILLKKNKYYILYELGSMKKAAALMRAAEQEGSPSYLMFSAIELEKAGEIKQAGECMRQAWNEVGNTEEEHSLRVQILNDYGRSYRISGNFREAVSYYKQAVEELRFPEDQKLAGPIYTNYIFTLCMLNPPEKETAQRALEEYKSHLDWSLPENRIRYKNIQISMVKQLGEEALWKKLIDENFDEIMEEKLPDEQRLVFEATHLRVAHTGGANFMRPLEAIRKDLDRFQMLKMPDRYRLIKEIHILFRPETPAAPLAAGFYSDVGEFADKYFTQQARSDIETYLKQLPMDAVYERCTMQMELCGITHFQKEYSFEQNMERMLSVRDVYESNGLTLDAMKVSLALADECFFLKNLDGEWMPKYQNVLQEALDYAESVLQGVSLHPECVDDFAQIAWMYLRIHQYVKCEKYIALFNQCNLTGAHYAPWLQMLTWASRLMARVLELKKRIEEIKQDPVRMQDLSGEAREWLRSYPENVDSLECTLLWGGLLDYDTVFVKRKVWLGTDGQTKQITPKAHHWLCIQEFNEQLHITTTILEIDMKYRFLQRGGTEKILFLANMHPLENGRDVGLRQDQETTHMYVKNVEHLVYPFPHVDNSGNVTKLEELRAYILSDKI